MVREDAMEPDISGTNGLEKGCINSVRYRKYKKR
jgi:hypothetical protein